MSKKITLFAAVGILAVTAILTSGGLFIPSEPDKSTVNELGFSQSKETSASVETKPGVPKASPVEVSPDLNPVTQPLTPAAAPVAAAPTVSAPTAPTVEPTPYLIAPLGEVPANPVMSEYNPADFNAAAAGLPSDFSFAIQRDLGITVPEYLAQAKAASDASAVVQSLEKSGVEVLDARVDNSILTVTVPDAADTIQVNAVNAVADVGGEPADDTVVEVTPAGDWFGGSSYYNKTSLCSSAFNGRSLITGQAQFATSGHCYAKTLENILYAYNRNAPGAPGTVGAVIGNVMRETVQFSDGYDSALVAITGAGVNARPGVHTWSGGAGAPTASSTVPVTGEIIPVVGAPFCKSGGTTGWTCGNITSINRTVIAGVNGPRINTFFTSACVRPGDSGGAGMVGTFAAGITAATANVPCSDPSYFSALFPMVSPDLASLTKANFDLKHGGQWELSLSSISAPTAIDTSTPGVLKGNVPNASTATKIIVYLEGNTEPFATTSAATGSWSIPLTGIPQGTYRFEVRTLWKTQKSGYVNGTVQGKIDLNNPNPTEGIGIPLHITKEGRK